MPTARRGVVAFVIIVVAFLVFLASVFGFSAIVQAFKIPSQLASDLYKIGFGFVASTGASVVTWLLIDRPPRGSNEADAADEHDESGIAEELRKVRESSLGGGEAPATDEAELRYLRRRKEEYKHAWQQSQESTAILTNENSKLRRNSAATTKRLLLSEEGGRWYSRWFATLLLGLLMACACMITSILQSMFQAWYQINVNQHVPWWVRFLQLLSLSAAAIMLPAMMYGAQRVRSDRTTTWSTVFQIGLIGPLIGGAMFLMQLPPELVSITITAFGDIPVTHDFQPRFFLYLLLQRVVWLPALGFFSAAFVHIVIPARSAKTLAPA